MKIHKLKKASLQRDGSSGWIWADGPLLFYEKLQRAYPHLVWERNTVVKSKGYSWCAQVSGAIPEAWDDLADFLLLLRRTLLIESSLDECFALGWHSKPGQPGKPALTVLGQWIHMAKSYNMGTDSPGSLPVAGLIAEQMVEFIGRHPIYRLCDGLVAALASNPEKTFDLPQILAERLEEDTGIPFLHEALTKTRPTAQMKYCPRREDKLDNIHGSIACRDASVAGKRILIVDDIIESGITLMETCRSLREAGATAVYGLAATKTLKNRFS